METVASLIEALGGRAIVAAAAGVEPNTVTYWSYRKRIPYEHWPTLIKLAKERRVAGIDDGILQRLSPPRKSSGGRSGSETREACDVAA